MTQLAQDDGSQYHDGLSEQREVLTEGLLTKF